MHGVPSYLQNEQNINNKGTNKYHQTNNMGKRNLTSHAIPYCMTSTHSSYVSVLIFGMGTGIKTWSIIL